ncbi:MAG: aquaporin family protein [Methylocystaceae bacterium]|nr:aquaporin family protein [Methylocystaceae bacterium]
MGYSLSKRVFAECMGTSLLVATVVGSGIMSTHLTSDVGLQLLGNTIPTGAILFVLINIFGPISGAHFNPVVSLVMALKKRLPISNVLPYIITQIIGGIIGTIIAHIMFDMDIIQLSTKVRTGNALWFAEFIATFGLVLTIIFGLRHSQSNIPALVAFYITAAYWFTASTSFANPAVTIARSFTNSFSGIAPTSIIGFTISQLIGALTALIVSVILLNDSSTT